MFLRTLSVCGRASSSGSGDEPAWSSLQGLAYAVFETLQSLLSVPSFVAVTQELLQHQVRFVCVCVLWPPYGYERVVLLDSGFVMARRRF